MLLNEEEIKFLKAVVRWFEENKTLVQQDEFMNSLISAIKEEK